MSRARNADAAKSLRLTLAGLVTAAMAFALMQTFLIPALPRLEEDLRTLGDLGHLDRHRLPAHEARWRRRSSAGWATSTAR